MPVVPTIDLDNCSSATPPADVVAQVADAAEHFGFFQVVNHGISDELIGNVWDATVEFFSQPQEDKRKLNRSKTNARGYYDRELTKNARDLKEVLDLAQVRYPELPDDHRSNVHAVDGQNQWPELVNFRSTIVSYLEKCGDVALWLLAAFCEGLGEHASTLRGAFGPGHTSFLRMNHYPLDDLLSDDEAEEVTGLGDMALHHHSDAGALTLLLQDTVGGLQVEREGTWLDVEPTPGAIVVNTGDMMQVWSNDRYQAALHRVLPRSNRERYSLPYFFNPSYETSYSPLVGSVLDGDDPHYSSINWGDFRQARADGDFADYGAEVQISDFAI
ncbi:MAG: isopenicillin N synthase-like dioxygenase [Verrucomicrobiales bacterium]|jgi:isopenicillin N synthase-like dioxygenase